MAQARELGVRSLADDSTGMKATMRHSTSGAVLLAGLVLVSVYPGRIAAQASEDSERYVSVLEREHPRTYDLLMRIERAHGVLLGELAEEGEAVRSNAGDRPTSGFEATLIERLTELVRKDGRAEDVADEAESGFAVLGPRAASIIERGNAFHREVLGILADPAIASLEARRRAVAAAVERYASRPDLALPSAPKNMDILYDHPQALAFRERYPDLDGLVWAGHWLNLAATEPIADLAGAERVEEDHLAEAISLRRGDGVAGR